MAVTGLAVVVVAFVCHARLSRSVSFAPYYPKEETSHPELRALHGFYRKGERIAVMRTRWRLPMKEIPFRHSPQKKEYAPP